MFRKLKNIVYLFRWGFHSSKLEDYEKQIQDKLDALTLDKNYYVTYHDKYVIGNGSAYACLFIGKRNNLYVPSFFYIECGAYRVFSITIFGFL